MPPTESIAGYGGTLTGAGSVTEIKEWEIEISIGLEDTTSIASGGNKEFTPTLIEGTISFNAVGKFIPPTTRAALTITATIAGGGSISGSVLVERAGASNPHEGVANYSFQGRFTGAITVTNPSP